MKKIFVLFLILGLVFAGPFPDKISGTELILLESSGDTTNGEAYYGSEGEVELIKIVAVPTTASDWVSEEQAYIDYGWNKKTVSGVDYYYLCETYYDFGEEAYCFVDSYQNGIWYMVDSSILGGTQTESLNLGVTVTQRIVGGDGLCPLGLLLLGFASLEFLRVKIN